MSSRLGVPLLTRDTGDQQQSGSGRLGGAGRGDGGTDVTNVICACVPWGVVQRLEDGKSDNNIANISETPFLPPEGKKNY